uniref:ATP-dependent DNA helicase n=1 Tax=Octopus bimaculoides TaxID=37653 RepID=A0A0L8G082_OCTBM
MVNISVEQNRGEFKIKLLNDICLESDRTIVIPTNKAAQFVNDFLLTRTPGSTLLIQRIPHVSQEMKFPFTFTRKLFPVNPVFALTCNKAQGQTFEQIEIYLPTQFFSHSQLYVALSKVQNIG